MLKLRGVPLLDLLDRISQSFICVVSVVNIPAVLSPRKLKAGGIIYSDLIIWTMGQLRRIGRGLMIDAVCVTSQGPVTSIVP